MGIVFDHVDGVVQRSPAEGADEGGGDGGNAPPDPEKLAEQMARMQRRKERLMAD